MVIFIAGREEGCCVGFVSPASLIKKNVPEPDGPGTKGCFNENGLCLVQPVDFVLNAVDGRNFLINNAGTSTNTDKVADAFCSVCRIIVNTVGVC